MSRDMRLHISIDKDLRDLKNDRFTYEYMFKINDKYEFMVKSVATGLLRDIYIQLLELLKKDIIKIKKNESNR